MTENQLVKLKNRLLNIQTQLNGASIILEKGEPFINSKITQANKLVAEAFEMYESKYGETWSIKSVIAEYRAEMKQSEG